MLRIKLLLVLLMIVLPINGLNPRNLDETPPGDSQNKCGNCPCDTDTPCNKAPPPPLLSPPPPKKSPTAKHPPPPSGENPQTPPSPEVYITGPPGSLYNIDINYARTGAGSFSLPLFVSSLLGLLAF
ncbi:unnamed protein product [Fraxinus pennsylvanica]|uniref:Uncharacterized protein n=1 Tax=Fraxinus pennsylvanica TaxID=56036 RepID=A0AAD2E8X4_9LAMI|nr:unnamed protein product [Fraxinus pennsylvanica]